MVNPASTQADLEAYATGQVATLLTGITFVADAPDADGETALNPDGSTLYTVNHRTVTASYTFNSMMPLVTIPALDLNTSSRTPVNP